MSKKTLLSALLISSFGFSSPYAAKDLQTPNGAVTTSEQTVVKFTANSKMHPNVL